MDAGQAIEPVLDNEDLNDFRARFLAVFGISNETVAEDLFQQLLNGLHTEPDKSVDSATSNLALALMHEISLRDAVEGMICVQMVPPTWRDGREPPLSPRLANYPGV